MRQHIRDYRVGVLANNMDRLKKHKLLRSIRLHEGCRGYVHRDGPVRKVRNPSRIAARAIVGGSDNGARSNEILKNSGRETLVQCETSTDRESFPSSFIDRLQPRAIILLCIRARMCVPTCRG